MLFANIDILDENLEHRKNQFVGVEDSVITYIGATEPPDAAKYGERYDGRGKLLMSAFYNTHAHTPMTLLRGYAENLPLQQWLNDAIWPFEAKMDPAKKHHYWGCMLSQAEMLRYGVVSYTDMYLATVDRCEATIEAGMKANHCDGGTMCFVETDYDTLPVAELNKQLFAEYHNAADGRVKIEMCVHAEYTTPQGMIERCVAEAREHGVGLHIHRKGIGSCDSGVGATTSCRNPRFGTGDGGHVRRLDGELQRTSILPDRSCGWADCEDIIDHGIVITAARGAH